MTFQPVLPATGLVGWSFLKRTTETQEETLAQSPRVQRETTYFRQNIASVNTAEALVADRRLLGTALSAFGLQDDIDNKFFIKTILEQGGSSPDALANRLTDQRYRELASAFSFDQIEVQKTQSSDFAEELLEQALSNEFQVAIGEKDTDLRLALGLPSAISDIASRDISNDGKWFSVMGTPPVRAVFEAALNLPNSIGSLDIDRQLEVFKTQSQSIFGTDALEDFRESGLQETLTRKFLLSKEVASGNSLTSGSTALTLLQQAVSSFG